MEDKRNILKDEPPFSYKLVKDRKALIYWQGKMIKIAKGKSYNQLEKVIASHDAYKVQLFLAKITGHFKHGNEKKGTEF